MGRYAQMRETHADAEPGCNCPGSLTTIMILDRRSGVYRVWRCDLCGKTNHPRTRRREEATKHQPNGASKMNHAEIWQALAKKFPPEQTRARSQAGKMMSYITARTVMNRLDEVLGPENWWDEYQPLEHSVICRLSLRLPDGNTITKCDAGGYAGMQDQGDDEKSGFSDAFKRAAVKFGVGRHLYGDGVPNWTSVNAQTAPEKTTSPGEKLAQWASRDPDRALWISQFGMDLEFPTNLAAWTEEQCKRASDEYRKMHPPRAAKAPAESARK